MTQRSSLAAEYLLKCREILDKIGEQENQIQKAAGWFAESILAGRMVHVFGSGHSRIMVEEMWPRYGSFPGFNPIVELSLTYHNNVVGANGQRQAMYLENVSGLAEKILRNFGLSEKDTALIISSSGCNVVPIEMAELFQKKKIKVVALITQKHLTASTSKRTDGKKLSDFADLLLDTGAPAGDSMIRVDGLETPVSPGSTVGGIMIINSIKAEVARLLTEAGKPPKVLTAGCVIGSEKATALFEAAYDEHAHRLAELYKNVGK
ncbi:MAG TPA: SIS domain-containing protein [Chitinophagaceae bacterium]|nr:SIS domain-containing protein [Chitinophagaceae bacterium]